MVIRILGTSHISSKSISAIRREIKENHPDIVGVELDIGRAQALQSKNMKRGIPWQMLPKIGLFGFMFVLIGRFVQQHLGKIVGVEPGSEMKEALVQAHKAKSKIALIDRPIQLTLKSLSVQFTFRDKMRMLWDLISGPFVGKKRLQEMGVGSFDLSGVPSQDVIVQMTGYIKKRYPGMYKALISERDKYMSKALIHLHNKEMKHRETEAEINSDNALVQEPVILAVVGAGHVAGMLAYLKKKKINVEVV
ncbi:hypothetical protein CL619_02705 [archaeon]|nr:hypothetical protein [archaeon]